MRHVRVRNHERFQHYKDRKPPWIKWHSCCLDSYSFTHLPDSAKWHAVGLSLLATSDSNHLPADPEWLAQRISASEPVNLETLIGAGFLVWCDCSECMGQDASKPLAGRKQSAREREGGGEAELGRDRAEKKGAGAPAFPPALDTPEFAAKWAEWEGYRREIRKKLTKTSRSRQLAALEKVGVDQAIAALDLSMQNGWTGVFPEKVGKAAAGGERLSAYELELREQAERYARANR